MSTSPTSSTGQVGSANPTSPTDSTSSTPTLSIVPQDRRDEFDAHVRELTGVPTPLPPISDAILVTDAATGSVLGTAYIAIRHVASPWFVVEGADQRAVLEQMMAVITDQLRATVRETLAARGPDATSAELASERGLSYDVYVPDGQEPPSPEAGFERLPVTVWRRRVC